MGLSFRAAGLPSGKDVPPEMQAAWSYAGFRIFRERLAGGIGIELKKMRGFGGDYPWQELIFHPLHILLNHSDCQGELSAEECQLLTFALAKAVWDWQPLDDYDRINAIKLCYQMNECARKGRALIFT